MPKDETMNMIKPELLRELLTIFTWLDGEHQQIACEALATILDDQITANSSHKTIPLFTHEQIRYKALNII